MLKDGFGRRVDYLRLSLTDRCDLRCGYCLPDDFHDFIPPAGWLTAAEIGSVVAAFAKLGVRRVRLTGGEPLTRRDTVDIAARIARLPGIEELSLTTNGTRLAQLADGLRQAGVRRLNVSLDSLDRQCFAGITGRDALVRVLAGLDVAATRAFDSIKINMVVMAGVNDDEVEDMADFCRERGFVLRFIEPMPMGRGGRAVIPADLDAIRTRLRRRFGLVDALVPGGGPARYLRSADGKLAVGFITPLSQHFCATCNRVRLSAEGALHLCLGQEDVVDLAALVRRGASQEDLMQTIRHAVARKPEGHEFVSSPGKIVRVMARTGG